MKANIKITPHKAGDGGIICMPLWCNVPIPKTEDWKLVKCPVCGAHCWETELARQTLKNEPDTTAACTMCALKAGLK